jgi:hypothetical protein
MLAFSSRGCFLINNYFCVKHDTERKPSSCHCHALPPKAGIYLSGGTMPTAITLPSCLTDCYAVLFPTLDFTRVAFFAGMPSGLSGADGFTMASGGPSPDIRVYVKTYEPCAKKTFLVIAHELVHVLQIQGMTGGGHIPGSWAAYYTSHALGCWGRGSHCANELEKEAYDYANGSCGTDGQLGTFVDTQMSGDAPCECALPWPMPNQVGGQTYVEALQANPGLAMRGSSVGRTWCSLLNWPLAVIGGAFSVFGFGGTGCTIGAAVGTVAGAVAGGVLGGALGGWVGAVGGAWLGAIVGGLVGGAIGCAIQAIVDWIGGLFSGPSARIWFTAFDGKNWVIPDIPVSQNGHSLTSAAPALAVYNGLLYLAYRGATSGDLWYNVFDGSAWRANDIKITQGGHTRTSRRPALAGYNGKLYLAYRGADSDELWYNVFDGASWLANDIKITQSGHTRTSHGPALAEYNGKLYLAYRGAGSDDLWYNVFDGSSWLTNDIKITLSGHTRTSEGPALAAYNGKLYLAYRGAGSDDLWYNVFDGFSWRANDIKITQSGHTRTSRGPALAVYNGRLYLAYRGADSSDLWYNVYDGANWQAQDTSITRDGSVQSAQGPALTAFGRFLFMVYRDNS